MLTYTHIVHISLALLTIFVTFSASIYDPSDLIDSKHSNLGAKSIRWQDETPSRNTQNLQIHHNYSRVSVQKTYVPVSPQNSAQTTTDRLAPPPNSQPARLLRKRRIQIHSACPPNATAQLVYHLSCNQFLNCWKGRGFVQNCPPGTLFNPKTLECDHPRKVECVSGARRSIHGRADLSRTPQAACPEEFSGLIPHYGDCGRFISCVSGAQVTLNCPPGTLFDANTNNCLHANEAVCVNAPRTQRFERLQRNDYRFHSGFTNEFTDESGGNAQKVQETSGYGKSHRESRTGSSYRPQYAQYDRQTYQTSYVNKQSTNKARYESHNIETSAPKCPNDAVGLHTHPTDCTKFLNCANGITYVQDCAPGTLFNPSSKICDFPYNVDCDRRPEDVTTNPLYDVRAEPKHFATVKPFQSLDFEEVESVHSSYHGEKRESADYVYEYEGDIILDLRPPKMDTVGKETCREDQFACNNYQCVPISLVCSGFEECSNGADEANCASGRFNSTAGSQLAVQALKFVGNVTADVCGKFCTECDEFVCKSFNYRKHDGNCYLLNENIGTSGRLIRYDVYDYYERTELTVNCTHMYECPNNRKCVSYLKLCDGVDDCGDRTDEKHCSAYAMGYAVELVGSESKHEGRIQVSAFGKTGFVCDDLFDLADANVVCRELGFPLGALQVESNSFFSNGLRDVDVVFLMNDVTCSGNESSLRDCSFSGWGVQNCSAQEVVGVVCKTREEACAEGSWKCDTGDECVPLAFLCDSVDDCADRSDEASHHCEAPIDLRLVNGSNDREGRVEVRYQGTWGTICDDDFNDDAAKVVCSYFGYRGSAVVKKDGFFAAGKGPIWLDQVNCQGNESTVQECAHWDWGEHNCDHSEDVGVVCSDYDTSGTQRHGKSEESRPDSLPVLPDTCGYRKDNQFLVNDDVHFRVVKGSVARRGDYPWQASLRVKNKLQTSHWCGAVVISSKFVLTAAHCLFGFAKGAYVVVAGDYNTDEDEGTEQEARIDDFYVHPEFRKGHKMNNDVAVVKLKGDGFRLTQDVQPICLVANDTEYTRGLNCTISGFGSTETGRAGYSHDLRAGWVPLQSEEVCGMPHVYGDALTEGMVCAGFLEEGVDACDGDSGGPLACLDGGLFTLYGLTSWGHHCGYANKPGVYVKVGFYRDWIDDVMKRNAGYAYGEE